MAASMSELKFLAGYPESLLQQVKEKPFLTDEELALFENARDKTPAQPMRFE